MIGCGIYVSYPRILINPTLFSKGLVAPSVLRYEKKTMTHFARTGEPNEGESMKDLEDEARGMTDYDKVLQAIKEMRPAAKVVKEKPATWWRMQPF